MCGRLSGVLACGQAGLRPSGTSVDVDVQPGHGREVEQNPSLGCAVAGHAVATAADRQFHTGLGRSQDRPGYVSGISRPDDESWSPVVKRVEGYPRLVIAGVI
jgi:hypothetical protein